jgi:hypothetical protein
MEFASLRCVLQRSVFFEHLFQIGSLPAQSQERRSCSGGVAGGADSPAIHAEKDNVPSATEPAASPSRKASGAA